MASLRDIVVDCRHPASLARFWASVLDGYEVAPYDETELQRLSEIGIDDPEDDPTVLLEPEDSALPGIWFQQVPEPKAGKNRVHIDLRSDQLADEVARIVELGARVVTIEPKHEGDWYVLADPEDNEFCVS